MNIESEVPSKELCEELKDAGWPQEGLFWWNTVHDSIGQPEGFNLELEKMDNESIAAPTSVQLLEVLPKSIESKSSITYWLTISKTGSECWDVSYEDSDNDLFCDCEESLPNALSLMVLSLVREGNLQLDGDGLSPLEGD